MARTSAGLDIVLRLMDGRLSGAALQTALASPEILGYWKEILKTKELLALLACPTSLAAIMASTTAFSNLLDIAGASLAASDTATALISNTPAAIFTVVSSTTYLNLWQNTPANKTRMQARVNALGSKLCRVSQTTPGTYNLTIPAGGILAYSYFVGAGGGTGEHAGSGGAGVSGYGGSGGELKFGMVTSGLPAAGANLEYIVGAAANNSSITGGVTALAGGSSGTGPGTTTGGTIYDTAPSTAIWQPNTGGLQGAAGGSRNSGGGAGGTGGTGISGAGGATQQPGTGIGSGGGGGHSHPSFGGFGSAASDPSCGGGGGGYSSESGGTARPGGAGAPGTDTLYYIKAA